MNRETIWISLSPGDRDWERSEWSLCFSNAIVEFAAVWPSISPSSSSLFNAKMSGSVSLSAAPAVYECDRCSRDN